MEIAMITHSNNTGFIPSLARTRGTIESLDSSATSFHRARERVSSLFAALRKCIIRLFEGKRECVLERFVQIRGGVMSDSMERDIDRHLRKHSGL
jgi:hypothetical protein